MAFFLNNFSKEILVYYLCNFLYITLKYMITGKYIFVKETSHGKHLHKSQNNKLILFIIGLQCCIHKQTNEKKIQ